MSNVTLENTQVAGQKPTEPENKPKKTAKAAQAGKTTRRPKKGKRVAKAAKKAAHKAASTRTNKKSEVMALMRQPKGATLAEIMAATGWQKHYADLQIMPTCVGNPACGAVIAAMESA